MSSTPDAADTLTLDQFFASPPEPTASSQPIVSGSSNMRVKRKPVGAIAKFVAKRRKAPPPEGPDTPPAAEHATSPSAPSQAELQGLHAELARYKALLEDRTCAENLARSETHAEASERTGPEPEASAPQLAANVKTDLSVKSEPAPTPSQALSADARRLMKGCDASGDAGLLKPVDSSDMAAKIQPQGLPKKIDPASYKKFLRSLEPAGERAARTQKAPTQIALAIKNEVKVAGGKMHESRIYSKWFQIYREAEGDNKWATVDLSLRAVARQRHWKNGVEKWLNSEQMLTEYKNATVVAAIKAECELNPDKTMPHPSAPTCEEAKLYLCVVELSQGVTEEADREMRMNMEMSLDGQSAATMAPMLLGASNHGASSLPTSGGSDLGREGAGFPGCAAAVGGGAAEAARLAGDTMELSPEETQLRKEIAVKRAEQAEKMRVQEHKVQERRQRREEKRMERERVKELNVTKAKTWATGFQKELQKLRDLLNSIKASDHVPAEIRKLESKKFREHVADLEALKMDLESDLTEEHTESKITDAKQAHDILKDGVKNWHKLCNQIYKRR